MYKLEVKQNETSDVSNEEFDTIVDSFISYIIDDVPDTSEEDIKREGNIIYFSSSLTVKEIKIALKPVFSHHDEDLRFVDLQ